MFTMVWDKNNIDIYVNNVNENTTARSSLKLE
jgi:hypothetical protein